ncbi:hypothetical protein [Spongiactinospora gelatinilytica]|nr:hypothetical protein [Spongiactinospora gelatinilytica]
MPAQIAELVWRLRLGLAQNSGGRLEGDPAAVSVQILERVPAWD